jgi:hypothetical protein
LIEPAPENLLDVARGHIGERAELIDLQLVFGPISQDNREAWLEQ